MTEIGILGADSQVHEGFHIWTDQAFFEVIDEDTGLPVAEGEEATAVDGGPVADLTAVVTAVLLVVVGDVPAAEVARRPGV